MYALIECRSRSLPPYEDDCSNEIDRAGREGGIEVSSGMGFMLTESESDRSLGRRTSPFGPRSLSSGAVYTDDRPGPSSGKPPPFGLANRAVLCWTGAGGGVRY